ncbi:MAG: LAGLIDADG family homing endonuclease, partial [Nanoarchaeota archaeon]
MTEYGYTKPIEAFESDFVEINIDHPSYVVKAKQSVQSVVSLDIANKLFSSKAIQFFMKKKHYGSIISFKTRLGYTLEVTEEHPVLTQRGMIQAGFISKEDRIAIHPFEGVDYQIPENKVIANNSLFTKEEAAELEKRGLLPLSLANPNIPIIAKLFGYLLGDGQIYLSGKKGFVCAYGSKEDLEQMQLDFKKLGFSARIYSRERNHKIPTKYSLVEFISTNYELHVSSKSLAKLFYAIGYPKGIKTNIPFLIPEWIINSSPWIKRLFLSGLFGAELSKPRTHTKTGFDCPVYSMNKSSKLLDNARRYCIQIIQLLEEFGIRTDKLIERDDFHNKQGFTSRIKLQISSNEDNLIKLWSSIGFSYNKKREILSYIGILYIKEKKALTKLRKETALRAKELRKKGLKLKEVQELLVSENINRRFVTRHYYENAGQRITLNFVSFNEFVTIKKEEFLKYGYFLDKIESIIKKNYDDEVYDFNVADNHNFIANNIIVSNCG